MSEARAAGSADPLSALAAAVAAVAHGADLDSTLSTLLSVAATATGAERGAVLLRDPDSDALELATTVGMEPDVLEAAAAGLTDPAHPIAAVVRDRAPALARPWSSPDWVHTDLPLVVTRGGIDDVLGAVSFAHRAPHEVAGTDAALLGAVADLAAVAVESARQASLVAERAEWYERMAQSDALTGLANARTVDRVLELEIARAGRQGGEVAVGFFDVDDFGAANSASGSAAGDDILRQVAAVLAESVRLVDTVARYGGDEFVLVAPGSAGMTVAKRIQDGIAKLPDVAGRAISVSVGLARFPADGTDGAGLIAAAAEAAHRAKGEGGGAIAEATADAAG